MTGVLPAPRTQPGSGWPLTAAIRIHLTLRQRQRQELERWRRRDRRPETTRVLPPKPLHEQLVAPLVRNLSQQLGLRVERGRREWRQPGHRLVHPRRRLRPHGVHELRGGGERSEEHTSEL